MGNKGWKEGTVVDQLGYATIKFCRGSPAYMVVGSNLRGGGLPPKSGGAAQWVTIVQIHFYCSFGNKFPRNSRATPAPCHPGPGYE
jgi:hypothetical protein